MTNWRDVHPPIAALHLRRVGRWAPTSIALILALTVLATIANPRVVEAQTPPNVPITPTGGTVRIAFRVSSSALVRAAAWVAARGTTPESTAGVKASIAVTPDFADLDIRTVEVLPDAANSVIASLQTRLDVAWAERVGVVRKHGEGPIAASGPPLAPRTRPLNFTGTTPNDPGFPDQWGLRYAAANTAWATARSMNAGTSTFVAIVDSGVEYDHPDLQARMAPNSTWARCETGACKPYVSTDPATLPVDVDGHGTHVAGIVAAATDNAVGVAGVAGDRPVRVIPVKALDAAGNGTTDGVAAGIAWAVARGAKVINMSLGGSTDTLTVNSAIDAAASAGVLITVSAGNCGGANYAGLGCSYQDEPDYPAAYAGTPSGNGKLVPVASITRTGSISTFSTHAAYVATGISAPGDYIYSTYKLGGYSTLSGTSMAAPHVAGAAAVLWTTFPNLTRTQVRDAILSSATTNAAVLADPNAYGKGLLNIDAALYAAQPGVNPSPTVTNTATSTATPSPTATSTPQPTNTPTATSTSTPTPTSTPQPANSVADVHYPRVASIRDSGLVVTWRSNSTVTGSVRIGTSGGGVSTIVPDDRGALTVSTLHFVTVQGLSPSQSYDLDIISGGVAWPTDGSHFSVTTGPTLTLPSPDTAYGTVLAPSRAMASEAIVVFEAITGPDRSLPDARFVRVADGGTWTLDLSGFRSRLTYTSFPIDATTILAATALLPDGSFGTASVPIATARVGASSITTGATVTQSVALTDGWNLLGLPVQPSATLWASSVCASLDYSGGTGTAVEVDRWNSGGWESHLCAISGHDFPLASPDGFAVRVTRPTVWTIIGTPFDGPMTATMGGGWSLVGARSPVAPTTSTGLLSSLSARAGGAASVSEIARWQAGQWESALVGLPVNRFAIDSGRAYFVRAPASFTWAIP